MSESNDNVMSAEMAADMDRLKSEVETKNRQMEEVRRRAEEIEINFREVCLLLIVSTSERSLSKCDVHILAALYD